MKPKKRAIIGRLDKILDIIDDKMEEATVYKSRKEAQAMRRQEIGVQAKAVKDHKLANLKEQPIYKVMQFRN